MNEQKLRKILEDYKNGINDLQNTIDLIKNNLFIDLGHTKLDISRELRRGFPEVIYCAGKTPEQVKDIVEKMLENNINILATRSNEKIFEKVKEITEKAYYNEISKTITIQVNEIQKLNGKVAILTAGTSDIPVAEEAAITSQFFGAEVVRFYDVGVAGIHRLFSNLDAINACKVIIVVAGMEGALPSIVGGLTSKPVIAVPTSVGYGASFNGLSALLTMLNSCASGVVVVNIDNGFGAGYFASMLCKL